MSRDSDDSKVIELSAVGSASVADRKRFLFMKLLKEEFLQELQYLCDVVGGRATARETLTERIVSQVKSVVPDIFSIRQIIEKLGDVAVFAANQGRDERTQTVARLNDELDLARLAILMDMVAREALRRYESFIVDRLSDEMAEGVIPFAKVGARRMLEKLSRTQRRAGQTIEVVLNESNLLAGLVEGRSGAWVDGFSNTGLKLKRLNKKGKPQTLDAETVYARPGFRHLKIHEGKISDTLYIREKPKHQEMPDWKNAFRQLVKKDAAVDDLKTVMKALAEKMAESAAAEAKTAMSELLQKLQKTPDWKAVIRALPPMDSPPDLKAGLHLLIDQARTLSPNPTDLFNSLLDKFQELTVWQSIVKKIGKSDVFYRFGCVEFRKGKDAMGAELKHDPKAGYVLMPLPVILDRYDYQPQDIKVISPVLQAEVLASSHSRVVVDVATVAAYLQWSKTTKKSLLEYVRSVLRYPLIQVVICHGDLSELPLKGANLSHVDLSGSILGGDLTGTDLSDSYLVGAFLKPGTIAHKIILKGAHAEFLQAQDVDFGGAILIQTVFDYAVLTNSNLMACQTLGATWRETTLTGVKTDADILTEQKQQVQQLHAEIKAQQQQRRADNEALNQQLRSLQEAHQSLQKQLAGQEEKLGDLPQQVQGLLQREESRLIFERHCQSELKTIQQKLTKTADKEEVVHLQSALQETQQELKQLAASKPWQAEIESFSKEFDSRLQSLGAQQAKLKQSLSALQKHVQEESLRHVQQQEERLTRMQAEMAQTQQALASRLAELEGRVLVLEHRVDEIDPRLSVVAKIKSWRQKVLADLFIREELAYYIAPNGQSQPESQTTEPLQPWVAREFLTGQTDVLLLHGSAGAGKSTFNRHFLQQLWQDPAWEGFTADTIPEAWLPLFIPLGSQEVNPRRLFEYLRYLDDPALRFTEAEIQVLQKHYRFLLIADGYDEMPGHPKINLYNENQLETFAGRVKLLITCRTQHWQSLDEKSFFQPAKPTVRYQRRCFSPFNETQIRDYIAAYLKKNQGRSDVTLWPSVEPYLQAIKKLPLLEQWINTPFFLLITVEILPTVSDLSAQETRTQFYDRFIDAWFTRQAEKALKAGEFIQDPESLLGSAALTTLQAEAKKSASKIDIRILHLKKGGIAFCQALATALKLADQTTVKEIKMGRLVAQSDASAPLSPPSRVDQLWNDRDPDLMRCRQASPLRKITANETGFIHASLIDYFATTAAWRDLSSEQKAEVSVPIPQSSVPIPAVKPSRFAAVSESATQSLLQKARLDRDDIAFLADRARQDPGFVESLRELIARSKRAPMHATGAVNAIAILNAANISFSGWDLSDIQAPGADFSGGLLEDTNLSRADLSHGSVQGAWMSGAILNGATLSGIRLGQLPYWPFPEEIKSVTHCVFSSHPQYLAVSAKHRIWVFDRDKGTYQELKGHTNQVTTLSFGPKGKGKWLVSGGMDWQVIVWDVEKGSRQKVCEGHTGAILSITWDPKGARFATCSQDKTLRLRNLDNEKLQMFSDKIAAHCIAWSAKGTHLAVATDNQEIEIWDMHQKKIATLQGHTHKILELAWDAAGKRLASSSQDSMIFIWDPLEGQALRQLSGHIGSVRSLQWDPSGERLASGGDDLTVRIWEVAKGRELHRFQGHRQPILDIQWLERADEKESLQSSQLLETVATDNCVRTWEIADRPVLRQMPGHTENVTGLAWNSQGNQLASCSQDKSIRIWDASGQPIARWATEEVCEFLLWDPSGQRVVVSDTVTHNLAVWQVDRGVKLFELNGHADRITVLAWHGKKNILASGSQDNSIRLWNMDEGSECKYKNKEPLQETQIRALTWRSADDALRLVVGKADKTVTEWDVAEQKQVKSIESVEYDSAVVAVHCLSNRVILGVSEKGMLRPGLREGAQTQRLFNASTAVRLAVFDAKYEVLAVASQEGIVNGWSLAKKKQLCHILLPQAATHLTWTSTDKNLLLCMAFGINIACYAMPNDHSGKAVLQWLMSSIPCLFLRGVSVESVKGLQPEQALLIEQEQQRASAEAKTESKSLSLSPSNLNASRSDLSIFPSASKVGGIPGSPSDAKSPTKKDKDSDAGPSSPSFLRGLLAKSKSSSSSSSSSSLSTTTSTKK